LLYNGVITDKISIDSDEVIVVSIRDERNFYKEFTRHPQVLRVVALSGGYSCKKANELLAKNNGMIASFSRALAENLQAKQTDDEFNKVLAEAIKDIYDASIT